MNDPDYQPWGTAERAPWLPKDVLDYPAPSLPGARPPWWRFRARREWLRRVLAYVEWASARYALAQLSPVAVREFRATSHRRKEWHARERDAEYARLVADVDTQNRLIEEGGGNEDP